MDQSGPIGVCLYNVSAATLFEETPNKHIVDSGLEKGRAHSSIVSVDAGTQYDAYVTIPNSFDLQGADGILLSISEGHTHNDDHSMQDTQVMYIPRLSCGTVEGDYIVSSFRRWNASGRDALHNLRAPQPNPNWMPGEIPHTLRPCLKANQGAIKLTLQRVRFERSGSNYIIRRKNPDHDISTVPPEHYRVRPRNVDDELRIINGHWVTPLEGEAGLPYVFDFVNERPEPVSDELN
ncbi:hypothetical protein LTR91_016483 [Friedmanniomyces endolithicus]|uniref:Uncharacterized protein n=1 Tax=Friedmanniomyces endolithicus TaxID=329885 RepID=A0AAN6QKJ3_9PEZI|nr:hypothetical protein LTR57_025094 [Friedmanniomyces endolithicus]KAK0954717.1 hypothetical protein LTS01_023772 [Friedmanniomyces endolithicus]KAK0969026.1 hypothetical protein LTR91_016483 [Friedmanniomyces endolithicus]KAK1027457.1 hypothetical protein LTS16_021455 [Friedmanniomyces endolithicus]